jgi:hypothetical protein
MRDRVPFLALLALSTLACGELPGEVVGTYRITMKLEENTCGAGAVNLLDGHRYAVELRSDDEYGYWRVPEQPPLRGSYEPPDFHFQNSGVVAYEGGDAGPRPCALQQVDLLTGQLTKLPDAGSEDAAESAEDEDDQELDAGADELDTGVDELDAGNGKDKDDELDAGDAAAENPKIVLLGKHVFTVSAVGGTDCSPALPPRGRFDKLPCTLRYAISGVKIKPF